MTVKRRDPNPRNPLIGYIVLITAAALTAVYAWYAFIQEADILAEPDAFEYMSSAMYFAVAAPPSLIAFFVIGTGFWIGWTILTIKVVPPMADIVEKKDYSKLKAVFLCLFTLAAAGFLGYGLYLKSFWAIAVPSAVIAAVILGAIFWVGIAIISARSTLPADKK
jgi:uncharacterized protein with PQ loop repeat